ncbi:putative mitochondrial 54s ribosomal protein 16 protein [Lasiodiplodia theobromae]|uniref:Mitochondrial 54s ribosomal protein n=1 Tax=Lasiodiplodia theobromae TaxID=45133 RepID=UPI0015C3F879|nr:Mitochondrial 54s ribosomal protein [Lasiodiplodia theobromae]KAF4541294.1 Mitochondrial 54s ribosomal protein [Lasiodiplodia theobromae]KAF9632743.1 putative mitochondrial 54s ribosomal protein 16 protein [Lasiodiplodia theobromae]
MFASSARRRCLQGASATLKSSSPGLFPAQAAAHSPSNACRSFSTSNARQSKIGRAPLSIPPEVQFEVIPPAKAKKSKISSRNEQGATVHVKGPLGEVSYTVPPFVEIVRETPTSPPVVKVLNAEERHQRAMWGTVRAYIQNHILGVSEGHTAILRLVGVGYRATIEKTATTVASEYEGQQFVNLKVGFSHPVELGIPKGVKASTPQPTRILLEGVEREAVMSFAADIRAWRKPEPYKGKGIFVNDEDIKLKSKKIK